MNGGLTKEGFGESGSVRLAEPEDVLALAELRWRWRVEERNETGMDHPTFLANFAVWVSERRGSHLAWLAERGGVPIGMAWLALLDRIPGPGNWQRLSGNLQSVYVVPEHRGSGAGALLVQTALAEARARELEYVSVHPSERSRSLYRRAGFRESPGVLEQRWDEDAS